MGLQRNAWILLDVIYIVDRLIALSSCHAYITDLNRFPQHILCPVGHIEFHILIDIISWELLGRELAQRRQLIAVEQGLELIYV